MSLSLRLHVSPPARDSGESEDAASLGSSQLGSPVENGSASTERRSRPGSKSTLEENAYEDILGEHSNAYADILDKPWERECLTHTVG